jgi:hypothetical protein
MFRAKIFAARIFLARMWGIKPAYNFVPASHAIQVSRGIRFLCVTGDNRVVQIQGGHRIGIVAGETRMFQIKHELRIVIAE